MSNSLEAITLIAVPELLIGACTCAFAAAAAAVRRGPCVVLTPLAALLSFQVTISSPKLDGASYLNKMKDPPATETFSGTKVLLSVPGALVPLV